MSEAKQRASDVVACLELLVDVAEQILKGQEPWAEVAVAQLTQYLVDAQEVARGAPPPLRITSVGAFHFGEGYEPFDVEGQHQEWLGDRIEAYERLAGAYQRLANELQMRLETER